MLKIGKIRLTIVTFIIFRKIWNLLRGVLNKNSSTEAMEGFVNEIRGFIQKNRPEKGYNNQDEALKDLNLFAAIKMINDNYANGIFGLYFVWKLMPLLVED